MESLISVIIPVYNTESYIGICLESLVKQTYTNFEVLMIDDGSTDNSGRICQEYTESDSVFITMGKKMAEFLLLVIWGLNTPEVII